MMTFTGELKFLPFSKPLNLFQTAQKSIFHWKRIEVIELKTTHTHTRTDPGMGEYSQS